MELSISCHQCVRRGTEDCADCLVSFVFGEEPDQLVLSAESSKLADLIVTEGLVPRLRFVAISSTNSDNARQ
jgi:hypothetical protein